MKKFYCDALEIGKGLRQASGETIYTFWLDGSFYSFISDDTPQKAFDHAIEIIKEKWLRHINADKREGDLGMSSYTIKRMIRDGVPIIKFLCPKCYTWGDIDDEQYAGKVSILCNCGFHETLNLRAGDEFMWKQNLPIVG